MWGEGTGPPRAHTPAIRCYLGGDGGSAPHRIKAGAGPLEAQLLQVGRLPHSGSCADGEGSKRGLGITAGRVIAGQPPGFPNLLTFRRPWTVMSEQRAPSSLRDLIL